MDHRRSDNVANKLQMETAGKCVLIQAGERGSPEEMGVLVIDANAGKENAMIAPLKVRWSKTGHHRGVARDLSNPNRNLLCCENATVDISNKGIKGDT